MSLEYRAVVALNNKGVTLLKRRCYRDATATFKDAIDVMGTILPDAPRRRRISAAERNECLKKASQCACRSSRTGKTEHTTTRKNLPSNYYRTVLLRDNCSEAISVALHKVPSVSSGSVLLIEFDEYLTLQLLDRLPHAITGNQEQN